MNAALMNVARWISVSGLILFATVAARSADQITEVTNRAAQEYAQRLQSATQELNDTRQRIIREQEPLTNENHTLEQQVSALQGEIAELEALDAQKTEKRQQLTREAGNLRKNLNYITTLAQDSVKTLGDSLLPGESTVVGERIPILQQKIEDQSRGTELGACLESVDFMLERTQQELGGYAARGTALVGEDNRLVPGTFAFVGPEAFFRAETGAAGTVRTREGSVPIVYPLERWQPAQQSAFYGGEMGAMPADPSGGKALRLREVNGTLLQHIQRGGVVAYAILVVGALAVVIMLQKLIDLLRFGVDTGAAIERALLAVRKGSKAEMEAAFAGLKSTTRDLFMTGLRHFDKPKSILEEHLFAHTLQIRLHYERRLPLLAVIATAAPLMGLLGTIMGMIKTFALITVFGTGNAGKLSGGISEVLVATELGLMVAIPALVAHGFLAHRIQKSLSLLDRYAVEFVTAAEEAKNGSPTDEFVQA